MLLIEEEEENKKTGQKRREREREVPVHICWFHTDLTDVFYVYDCRSSTGTHQGFVTTADAYWRQYYLNRSHNY